MKRKEEYKGGHSTKVEEEIEYKIYPIPFNNKITIDLNKENKVNELLIYNIEGIVVYSNSHIKETTIDLSWLSAGIYFAKIGNKFERLIKK